MHAHGKLLLTAEYAVLDGTKAFAIPLRYGQRLKVSGGRGCDIVWEAYDEEGEEWFKSRISLFDFKPIKTTCEETAARLTELLTQACNLNSDFLSTWKGMKVKTSLEFPTHYGWGSSSTLLHLVAQWAEVDPFVLMKNYNNGSGYDIACADAEGPILYKRKDDDIQIHNIDWNPSFLDKLYLLHQGEKRNTPAAIEEYRNTQSSDKWLADVDSLTDEFITAENLSNLEEVMNEHEAIISERLGQKPLKKEKFNDYWGAIKSLGAWGGDFALITSDRSEEETKAFFQDKGYNTFLRFDSVLLNNVEVEAQSQGQ